MTPSAGPRLLGPAEVRLLAERLDLRPTKQRGQNFVIDPNTVRRIVRDSGITSADVVLEVGPGLGVLTRYLAQRVRLVHAVELDRRLEPPLRETLAGHPNVELVFGDALALPLHELDPPPGKLVANLPYSIATPLVAESLGGLSSVELWCVLVQREVADRFFALPRTKSYGAVSVLVQLTAERTGFHPVARTCFHPPPNVDSALVAFRRRRRWGPELERVREVVHAAFGHRRKTLANALELAGFERRGVEAALDELGVRSGVRAEALAPEELERLAEHLT